MKLIEPFKRKKLAEGRSFGLGFSIVKEDGNMMIPFTACKDYLNDIIFIEKNNVVLPAIYGFKHKYNNLFDSKFYLVVKPLHHKSEKKYDKYKQILDCLKKDFIINNINKIETELGLEHSTVFKRYYGKLFLNLNPIWYSNTASISFITLLIRSYLDKEYTSESDSFVVEDNYLKNNINKFLSLSQEKRLKMFEFNLPKNSTINQVHNYGISQYLRENEK